MAAEAAKWPGSKHNLSAAGVAQCHVVASVWREDKEVKMVIFLLLGIRVNNFFQAIDEVVSRLLLLLSFDLSSPSPQHHIFVGSYLIVWETCLLEDAFQHPGLCSSCWGRLAAHVDHREGESDSLSLLGRLW